MSESSRRSKGVAEENQATARAVRGEIPRYVGVVLSQRLKSADDGGLELYDYISVKATPMLGGQQFECEVDCDRDLAVCVWAQLHVPTGSLTWIKSWNNGKCVFGEMQSHHYSQLPELWYLLIDHVLSMLASATDREIDKLGLTGWTIQDRTA